jgi:hypothetical protein
MRCGAGVAAAAVLAAVVIVMSGRALAETDEDGRDAPLRIATDGPLAEPEENGGDGTPIVPPDGALTGTDEAARDAALSSWGLAGIDAAGPGAGRYLLFSTTDFWRQGGFSYGGVLWAPNGLDREGIVVKLIFGGGVYRYVSGALGDAQVIGQQLSAAILPGWRFTRDKLIVTVFVGPEFQSHTLSPNDPGAGLRGQYVGARAGFELWYEPTATTMVAADASISTIGVSYTARLAGGLKLLDLFYGGPELQAFAADRNYRQYRAGVHLTGLRTGDYEWSAGLGWARDSDDRSSIYGKLGMLTRR